jgi:hypothetical protein
VSHGPIPYEYVTEPGASVQSLDRILELLVNLPIYIWCIMQQLGWTTLNLLAVMGGSMQMITSPFYFMPNKDVTD